MAFVTDKSELKPGLVLFRRGDVEHRMRTHTSFYAEFSNPSVLTGKSFRIVLINAREVRNPATSERMASMYMSKEVQSRSDILNDFGQLFATQMRRIRPCLIEHPNGGP